MNKNQRELLEIKNITEHSIIYLKLAKRVDLILSVLSIHTHTHTHRNYNKGDRRKLW